MLFLIPESQLSISVGSFQLVSVRITITMRCYRANELLRLDLSEIT